MKVDFHYAHYTRTFQKQKILVCAGTVSVEVDMDMYATIADEIQKALAKILDVFEISDRTAISYKFSPFHFKPKETKSKATHIWERELGYPGTGDFLRVTSAFPPEIQEKYEKDYNDYMDVLSMPEV